MVWTVWVFKTSSSPPPPLPPLHFQMNSSTNNRMWVQPSGQHIFPSWWGSERRSGWAAATVNAGFSFFGRHERVEGGSERKKENKADAVQGVCFSFCSAAGGVDAPLVESAGERVRPAGGGAAAQPPVRVSASLILTFFLNSFLQMFQFISVCLKQCL